VKQSEARRENQMARSVGVDLGTTDSVVSVLEGGEPTVITYTGGSALPRDGIDRMVREAEQHAEEDRRRREAAETRDQGEQLVPSTEKLIKDNADNIPADARSETETALAGLKEKLKGEDTVAIRQAIDRTAQDAQRIGTALYQKSRAEQPTGEPRATAGDGTVGGSSEDDVVDAEIVDDDKPEAG
jgi:molecular chaperone DnaK